MNTTQIGDDFESRSIKIIEQVMADRQLGHMTPYFDIVPKARYHSPMRQSDVIFDIAIEIKPPGAKRCVLIYIIECKNHTKRVSVDKVKSFLFDIKDVGFANVKGIVISNSPLQRGALDLADSGGLMVIQGESAENYKILFLHKTNRDISQKKKLPTVGETLNVEIIDEGSRLIEKLIDEQLLSAFETEIAVEQASYGIDLLNKARIEGIAEYQLNKINTGILTQGLRLSILEFENYMNQSYGIEIVDLGLDESLWGYCDIEQKKIGLNPAIWNINREFFVLAHEFGHFVLHQKLKIEQSQYDLFSDSQYSFKTGTHLPNNARHWIEWQANYFAACFTMPKGPVAAHLFTQQDRMRMTNGKILLDDNPRNLKVFYDIVHKLAYRFYVLKTSVIYKLNELGLINNRSREKSIGQLISVYLDGMFP